MVKLGIETLSTKLGNSAQRSCLISWKCALNHTLCFFPAGKAVRTGENLDCLGE